MDGKGRWMDKFIPIAECRGVPGSDSIRPAPACSTTGRRRRLKGIESQQTRQLA